MRKYLLTALVAGFQILVASLCGYLTAMFVLVFVITVLGKEITVGQVLKLPWLALLFALGAVDRLLIVVPCVGAMWLAWFVFRQIRAERVSGHAMWFVPLSALLMGALWSRIEGQGTPVDSMDWPRIDFGLVAAAGAMISGAIIVRMASFGGLVAEMFRRGCRPLVADPFIFIFHQRTPEGITVINEHVWGGRDRVFLLKLRVTDPKAIDKLVADSRLERMKELSLSSSAPYPSWWWYTGEIKEVLAFVASLDPVHTVHAYRAWREPHNMLTIWYFPKEGTAYVEFWEF
jgi:hypothetical protein